MKELSAIITSLEKQVEDLRDDQAIVKKAAVEETEAKNSQTLLSLEKKMSEAVAVEQQKREAAVASLAAEVERRETLETSLASSEAKMVKMAENEASLVERSDFLSSEFREEKEKRLAAERELEESQERLSQMSVMMTELKKEMERYRSCQAQEEVRLTLNQGEWRITILLIVSGCETSSGGGQTEAGLH